MNPLKTLSGKDKSSADSDYQINIMGGLQPRPFPDGSNPKHVYAGTVSRSVRDRRRAKNRVARKSRRKNRAGGK